MPVEVRTTIVYAMIDWIIRNSRSIYYRAWHWYEVRAWRYIANPGMKPETTAMTIIGF
jgi:hypothetical protein